MHIFKMSNFFSVSVLLPVWKPIAVHRWSPTIHRSPTGGPLMWHPQLLRWKLIHTPLATDGFTGIKSVSIPSWYSFSVILGLIPSKYSGFRSFSIKMQRYSIRNKIFGPISAKYSNFRSYSIRKTTWGLIPARYTAFRPYSKKIQRF